VVSQLLNFLSAIGVGIPSALGAVAAATVSSLVTALNGAVTNLICTTGSTLSEVASDAKQTLLSMLTPLSGFINTLTSFASNAAMNLNSTVIAQIQSELTALKQMMGQMKNATANMTQMGK